MKPIVYMMLGLPGSGKTTFSKQLETDLGLPRFSLDEEYFALVGNSQQEQRDFEKEKQVAESIKTKVAKLLLDGESVVLDYCPWKQDERATYRSFVESHGGFCKIYYFDVPKEELLRRFEARNQKPDKDTQYMTLEMLEDFYERFDIPKNEVVEVVV